MSEYEPPVTGDPQRSRRRRATITLTVVALILFGAFWYAYSYVRGATASSANTPTPTCTTAAPTAVVTVNVYNATTRNGLAGATAEQLKKRGIVVAKVANDPLKKTLPGVAEVRYGKAGTKQAATVIAMVPGASKLQDSRKDATVDLVLGNKYTSLKPTATGATLPPCPATSPTKK
ncbi:MAG: LytR C-terminal domain-containing protein [Nostocoides sp.]